MRSRYHPDDAESTVTLLGARWGEDLALRTYTSRLLGADPSLVLHGGGNTSVKTTAREIDGSPVEVLCVKGSGWDLATIEPQGFAACRLEPLRRLCALEALDDDAMVAGLRSQMLDPSSPTPSVEALLHAFLPGKFVDHTHADAVCALQDQPDARAIAHEVWGDAFLFIPYVMPGFALARRVVELGRDLRGKHGLILEQHGIFTWGATALESYERMIDGVRSAAEWRTAHRPAVAVSPAPLRPDHAAWRRRIAPRLRGALARAGSGRFVMEWRDEPAIRALLAHPAGRELTARGTVTPDHVIRTKPRPLWLDLPTDGAGTTDTGSVPDALTSRIVDAVAAHAADYAEFVRRGTSARAREVRPLDAAPRLVLVPGCGALTLGRTLADARIAGDILARAAQVMLDAEAVGRYTPVGELDLFDVEYWSLEQAKLAKGGTPGPLAGRIALVTGAAAGIGRATAEHLLALGAHVCCTDIDGAAVAATASGLAARAGLRVTSARLDVMDAASVRSAIDACIDSFGGIDLLVSNAGTAPQGQLHTAEGEARLAASLDINLMGHERVSRAVTDVLLAQDIGGCLLYNASKSAVNPGPDFGPYAVAKAGLLALMRQYAVDLGAHGIRSNAVNADRIRTDLFGGGVLEARAKARGLSPEAYFRQNLLGRETTAADVAAAFGWLAQAEATTGCVVTVDGGNAAAFLR